ncbi:UNVERIFIED_CONTAM: hypothetical protein GTU68_003711 [Idotea baltica]|nr:hypothetical protein [Idotea baltica]
MNTQELSQYGISEIETSHWNLSPEQLLEHALKNNEGVLTSSGAFACETGPHTGRSPNDKFIVKDISTEELVDWGDVNRPMSVEAFTALKNDQLSYLKGKSLYVREALAGSDEDAQIPIRVINETAWANLFAHHMFLRPSAKTEAPLFTIIHTPYFEAEPAKHSTNSSAFIVVNFSERLVLIGGTKYAGEIKKSIFSVLNFLYPQREIFPMHCSANFSKEGEAKPALFFGLSGTGKTTLSASNDRVLVGDDEHGWSAQGVFNFEGGCYAKAIRLTREKEPQIYDAVRDGAILENVVLNADGTPNYDDGSLAENSRAAYPLYHLENVASDGRSAHPKNVVFLTCDAFGVLPAVSKLSPAQAMYHFLSGYTAKVAGTERGLGSEPQAVFSACFGAPFLPLPPTAYATMLGNRLEEFAANCWLVNTGWIGGGVGVGKRISLSATRTIVDAITSDSLTGAATSPDPIFGLAIPTAIEGVDAKLLQPQLNWANQSDYDEAAKSLSARFKKNFTQFVAKAGLS